MKITGFYFAWACEDWVLKSIANKLKICDEIFVSVQAHTPQMALLADKTESLVANLGDKRVHMVPQIPLSGNIDVTKCKILNSMLELVCTGDTIMLCDSDEFYDDNAIKEIKEETAKDDWDMIRVHDRFFCINMNWYLGGSHGRFWKVKQGSKFYPTQNILPEPLNVKLILEDNPMFHYSMLMPLEYRKAFWESEQKWHMVEWLDKIYTKWNLDAISSEMKELASENYRITGHDGFWFNGGVDELDMPPYLHRFEGSHPEEIEFSTLRNKKDYRI